MSREIAKPIGDYLVLLVRSATTDSQIRATIMLELANIIREEGMRELDATLAALRKSKV